MPPDVADALDLARQLNPDFNIFTSIEDRPNPPGQGPLSGVPIAVKDMIDHEGRVTTCGSAFYRHTATRTADCLLALEAAGAVIIGRTGMHEWAFGFSSENPHWGPVRNPWDPTTSTGGSSGGSAAAVASGIVPIAIGTDTGGSVRVPSALCGTFGLKVTYGRIPLDGVFPLVASIDSVGPLANSVKNLATAYEVMAGVAGSGSDPRPLRVGIPQPWFDEAPMSVEVADAFDRTVHALTDLGHDVVAVTLPDIKPSHHIGWAIAEEVREVHRPFLEEGSTYGDDVARRLADAASATDDEIAAGRAWQKVIRDQLGAVFEEIDLLVTPTVPVRSKVIGEDMIGDLHYRAVLSYFVAVVNHTLHPAIALPLNGTGSPPLSLQAIGPINGEDLLLGFARTLESEGICGFSAAPVDPTGISHG